MAIPYLKLSYAINTKTYVLHALNKLSHFFICIHTLIHSNLIGREGTLQQISISQFVLYIFMLGSVNFHLNFVKGKGERTEDR